MLFSELGPQFDYVNQLFDYLFDDNLTYFLECLVTNKINHSQDLIITLFTIFMTNEANTTDINKNLFNVGSFNDDIILSNNQAIRMIKIITETDEGRRVILEQMVFGLSLENPSPLGNFSQTFLPFLSLQNIKQIIETCRGDPNDDDSNDSNDSNDANDSNDSNDANDANEDMSEDPLFDELSNKFLQMISNDF